MNKALLTLILFLTITGSALSHEKNFRFINGNIYNGNEFEKKEFFSVDGNFVMSYDGRIDSTIDLLNMFVISPFADAHNHIIADGMNYKEQIDNHLRLGIFYVKNPNNTSKLTEPLKQFVNIPESVDIIYSNGGLTASSGHPVQIYKFIAEEGIFPGWTNKDMENQAYFIIDNSQDLESKWSMIKSGKPDFIKVYLDHSEEFEIRKNDDKYFGRKGLNPELLPSIVKKAHVDGYRVSAHISSPEDFHNALQARVDEINHLPLGLISVSDAELAAKNKTVIVTTTLSHRPLGEIKNIDEIHEANLKLLKSKGVIIAIGTDNGDKTSFDEIMNIKKYNLFDNAELLKMWTMTTTEAIYPGRKISQIEEGHESNFLVLEGNPVENFENVRNIKMRVKSGHIIEVSEVIIKPSINDAIGHTLMLSGVGAAIDEYKKLKVQEAEKFDFSEQQLNELGYELIKRKMYTEAIEIFKLNVEEFPHSSNVYDSLGESYLLNGNKDLALKNYEKSVELNPKNENGKKVLEELRK